MNKANPVLNLERKNIVSILHGVYCVISFIQLSRLYLRKIRAIPASDTPRMFLILPTRLKFK